MKSIVMTAVMAVAAVTLTINIVAAPQFPGFGTKSAPEWESFEEMQDFYIRRFVGAEGFGLSRMPQPPMLDRSGVLDFGRARYAIERLELVGLLKQAEPVVYEPRRHNVRTVDDFRTRSLTAFETRALAALAAGGDVETAPGESGTVLMVGALRGDPSCLKCHTTRRSGELLGAFTYTLRPK